MRYWITWNLMLSILISSSSSSFALRSLKLGSPVTVKLNKWINSVLTATCCPENLYGKLLFGPEIEMLEIFSGMHLSSWWCVPENTAMYQGYPRFRQRKGLRYSKGK
ncbi:unnamed protein product [Brassica oleracea]